MQKSLISFENSAQISTFWLIIKKDKAMKKFKRHRDYGFWDQDIRMSKLSQLGDPLEKLNEAAPDEIDDIMKLLPIVGAM